MSQSEFDAVIQAKDWQLNRCMLYFDITAERHRGQRQAGCQQCLLMPVERFHSAIEGCITLDALTLTQLASSCTTRLGRMGARNAVAASKQGRLQLR